MRISRKQQLLIRQEHGVQNAGYGESLRLGTQSGDIEAGDEWITAKPKVRLPRVRT